MVRGKPLLNPEGTRGQQALRAGFKGTVETGQRRPDKWLGIEREFLSGTRQATSALGCWREESSERKGGEKF